MRLEADPLLPFEERRELLAAAHQKLTAIVKPVSEQLGRPILCQLDCRRVLVDLTPSVTVEWPEELELPAEINDLLVALTGRGLTINPF